MTPRVGGVAPPLATRQNATVWTSLADRPRSATASFRYDRWLRWSAFAALSSLTVGLLVHLAPVHAEHPHEEQIDEAMSPDDGRGQAAAGPGEPQAHVGLGQGAGGVFVAARTASTRACSATR